MARAIWSGSISFGLVNVPIKVVTAVRQNEVRFHQLRKSDGSRLKQKRISAADGEEVAFEDIVKGYEVAPDEYVVITPEELEALDPESTRLIDIEEFIDLADIDPLYYDKSYYLVPNTGGAKAYRVLLDAMRKQGKVALGRVVLRTKQYLVALRPLEDALVMTTLNYADELVPTSSLEGLPEHADASPKELTMAQQLIEALSGPFEPEKYRDEHREKVVAMIEAKAAGKETVSQPVSDEPNVVVDLMAALEQSLKQSKGSSSSNGSSNGASAEKPVLRAAASRKKTSATKKVTAKAKAPAKRTKK